MFKKPADVLAIRFGHGHDAYETAVLAAYDLCDGSPATHVVEVFTDDVSDYGEYWVTDTAGTAWVEDAVDNVGVQVIDSYGCDPEDID